jgi:hypothetical protein
MSEQIERCPKCGHVTGKIPMWVRELAWLSWQTDPVWGSAVAKEEPMLMRWIDRGWVERKGSGVVITRKGKAIVGDYGLAEEGR